MSDLISRQDAIKCCRNEWEEEVEERLRLLPSIERTGHWIEKEDPYGFFNSIPVCSECGCTTKMREKTNYCPTCGADMRGEKDVD